MKKLTFTFFFLILFPTISFSKTKWESGAKKVPLIELYSSEGCSSCPPAEKWMAELINDPDHFVKFTPINFHVDYWNQLGWIDRFSKAQFTDRQKQYAGFWGTGRIYTPAFVVNGVDSGPVGKSVFLNSSDPTPGNLTVSQTVSMTFEITFSSKEKSTFEVYFLELGNGLKSNVTKGENEGRTLTHNFVALKLTVVDLKNEKATIKIKDSGNQASKTNAFAVWITKKGSLIPIQSIGGYL